MKIAMPILKILFCVAVIVSSVFFTAMAYAEHERCKVGLLIVATGRYIQFVEPLIISARTHFCKNHDVTYFVFTDGQAPEAEDVASFYQSRLGWPYDTMMRFEMYHKQADCLKNMDYLFACDADMLFVDDMGDEILAHLVATMHPGYAGRRGTYEENPHSTAYVRAHEGKCYFAGGFLGGSSDAFLAMAQHIVKNIYADLAKNIIAVWHDESHVNRYFIDHRPSIILPPQYCCPETWQLPARKLLALDKNHAQMRKA